MQFCIGKTAVNRILGRKENPCSERGFSFLPNKTERSKTTFPLKEKTYLLVLVCMSHSLECVCPTRASGYGTPVRVATPDPSDARGSFRAMREVRSERCERLVPSDARGSFRAIREVRSERCERLVPGDTRGSFRAIRKVRAERCERLVPSDANGSSRAIRKVRAGRYERLVPSDARGSFRVIRMVRAGRREAFPLFVGSG